MKKPTSKNMNEASENFLDEMNTLADKADGAKKNLQFEKEKDEFEFEKEQTERANFKFFSFKEDGDEFVGRLHNVDASKLNPAIEGVAMVDLDGEIIVLGNYYQLVNYFKDAARVADFEKVYKIVRKEKLQLKKNSVIVFDIYKAK